MQAAVFDLDGTVLNTQADIAAACNTILAKHGYSQHPLDAYRQMVGNGFDVLVRRALPQDLPVEPGLISEIAQETRAYYAGHMMERTRPYPGLEEALHKLAQAGIALALLSNKPDYMTQELIRHYFADIPFAKIQGAMPDIPLKPDPSSLLAILHDMGAPLDSACYIGDSNVDMQTAQNAKIMAIGAAWGFRGARELEEAGADLILEKPEELTKILALTQTS